VIKLFGVCEAALEAGCLVSRIILFLKKEAVMKRVLLISLSLALALVGWRTVCAQDGFYVIPAMKGKYAPVPKTGQTTSYASKDDGDLKKGVAWPTPRFTDNLNGTVTDKLTGLIWTKNANYFGLRTWDQAMSAANSLQSGSKAFPDLTDGSKAGDWRLANVRELVSLIDFGRIGYALPEDHPFTGVQDSGYWSSTSYTDAQIGDLSFMVRFGMPSATNMVRTFGHCVWCVRDRK
jgi:hypothetical protein